MKLYKFRSLVSSKDFRRVKEIIEEEKFWCSRIWDLNDPMEGVYKNRYFNRFEWKKTFNDKNEYLICSFSGKIGLKNPILWGYYAYGFKGLAIEIEVENNDEIQKIKYVNEKKFMANLDDAEKIITRKFKYWEHEDEYRFLIKNSINKQKIGKITKIIFGNPYSDLINYNDILKNSKLLRKYNSYKEKLIEICENKNIDYTNFII